MIVCDRGLVVLLLDSLVASTFTVSSDNRLMFTFLFKEYCLGILRRCFATVSSFAGPTFTFVRILAVSSSSLKVVRFLLCDRYLILFFCRL